MVYLYCGGITEDMKHYNQQLFNDQTTLHTLYTLMPPEQTLLFKKNSGFNASKIVKNITNQKISVNYKLVPTSGLLMKTEKNNAFSKICSRNGRGVSCQWNCYTWSALPSHHQSYITHTLSCYFAKYSIWQDIFPLGTQKTCFFLLEKWHLFYSWIFGGNGSLTFNCLICRIKVTWFNCKWDVGSA